MRIQTAWKRKNRFSSCKEIWYIIIPSEECIGIVYWSYITAKAKFADKTMVKTVMLMSKLCFWIIGMMTLFFRKLLFQVAYTIERLKQYWEQHRNSQRKIKYELFPFHRCKGNKTKKLQQFKAVVFVIIKL